MRAPTGHAAYTYAVARPFHPARLARVRGVDGAAVTLVGYEDIVAAVSSIPPPAVGPAALRVRLEDLAELEAMARAHHAVVDTLATIGVTLPFRLATVHHTKQRVVEVLRHRYWQLDAMLDRFTGRVEMGVKVYAVADEPTPAPIPARTSGEPASASPGRDYLRRRREQSRRREDTWRRASTMARHLDTELAALAEDCRHHRPQDPRLSDAEGENVLNAAFLIEARRADAFVSRARVLAAEVPGTHLVTTGPWAPYSFAQVDGEEPAGDDLGRPA
jgi:Gas vesicle synthesis protein GvpL/GvpF